MVDWKNIGHIPVFWRNGIGVKRWRGMPEGEMPVEFPSADTAGTMPPDGVANMMFNDLEPLSANFLKGLPKTRDHARLDQFETIYFFGRVIYDTIGRPHHTDFCAYLMDLNLTTLHIPNPLRSQAPFNDRYLLRQCPKWNTSD